LICPECHSDALKIVMSIDLPPDSRSDEITVQTTGCEACGFTGLAIYEESRRGTLNRESVMHRGYYVSSAHLAKIQFLISQCPDHRNPHCKCKTHHMLGKVDMRGRWNGLDEMMNSRTYDIELK
jgi:hypothetical protein